MNYGFLAAKSQKHLPPGNQKQVSPPVNTDDTDKNASSSLLSLRSKPPGRLLMTHRKITAARRSIIETFRAAEQIPLVVTRYARDERSGWRALGSISSEKGR